MLCHGPATAARLPAVGHDLVTGVTAAARLPAALPRPAGVYDMIYNPPRTPLLREAGPLGLPCANGLAMLVHQGAKSLEIWTGIPAARTAPFMQEAAEAATR